MLRARCRRPVPLFRRARTEGPSRRRCPRRWAATSIPTRRRFVRSPAGEKPHAAREASRKHRPIGRCTIAASFDWTKKPGLRVHTNEDGVSRTVVGSAAFGSSRFRCRRTRSWNHLRRPPRPTNGWARPKTCGRQLRTKAPRVGRSRRHPRTTVGRNVRVPGFALQRAPAPSNGTNATARTSRFFHRQHRMPTMIDGSSGRTVLHVPTTF